MRKITLLAVLVLALGMRAERTNPFPDLENQTKFSFASLGQKLSELQSLAYQSEVHESTTTGIDLYIHVDGDQLPRVHAWTGNGNLTTWPGVELTTVTTVARIGSDVKKEFYKIHFDDTSLTFLVNWDGADGTTIQTNNMNVLEAGSYFFDFTSYLGYDYNHTNNKAETHYTLAPINDYYNGGTDLNQNTIYAKSDISNIPPSLYCYSTWNKDWNADWAHWGMNPATVNGDSQWYVNGPFNHSEISGMVWNGEHQQMEKAGGLIISDWMNEATKTCDITWLGGGDYFFYYFPEGHADKYEPVVLMNGRTNYFQEMTFIPNATVTDDTGEFAISMIDENTIQFAQMDQDGFTLTISDPNGVKASELIANNRLRLYLNSTLTLETQQKGHNINMIAHGAWFGNPQSTTSEVFDTDQMLLAGSFNVPACAPVDSWGNDYTLVGGSDAGTAYNHVIVVDAPKVSYTLTNRNYAIGGQYVEFDSIRVRDDHIASGIVDSYGTYRGFSWTITSPMVIIKYSGKSGLAGHGENYTGEGIIYCRSLEPSVTYEFPKPTAEQVALGRIGSHAEAFTNYDWLAIRLTGDMKEEWDKKQPSEYEGFVIKPNTIKGYYCDFIQNLSRLATAFLNPTIIVQDGFVPEIDENQWVDTRLNNYYLFNFVRQDDVFFIPPKRNEVCNVNYVLPSGDDYVVYGAKTDFEDKQGNVIELKSKVRIYGYYNDINKSPEMDDYNSIYTRKSTWEMCRDNETAIVRDALVQMIFHHGEACYKWNENQRQSTNGGNGEAEYLMAPRYAQDDYFYNPVNASQGDPGYNELGYLLPMLDYGGGGDSEEKTLEGDGKIAKYYGVFGRHRLAINPNLAVRNPKNVENPFVTAIEEVNADNSALKTVAKVEYYNATGMMSKAPFDGFNIVVTHYSDGTMSARKIFYSK